MALDFYYASGSPFAWRVWLALERKGVAYELKLLSFSAGDTRKPEFLALNPRHQVPVLVDSGFALYESAAIVEYLDERFPGREHALFPGDSRGRAQVRRLVVEADNYFAPANQMVIREVLFKASPEEWDMAKLDEGKEKLAAEMTRFEREMRGDFLAGSLSAADFALYPMLALALRTEKKKDVGVRQMMGPKLTSWAKRIESLPYFDKTIPPHWKG